MLFTLDHQTVHTERTADGRSQRGRGATGHSTAVLVNLTLWKPSTLFTISPDTELRQVKKKPDRSPSAQLTSSIRFSDQGPFRSSCPLVDVTDNHANLSVLVSLTRRLAVHRLGYKRRE